MIDMRSKIENARKLAELNERDAKRYRKAHLVGLAEHHAIKAREWRATAETLEAQALANPASRT